MKYRHPVLLSIVVVLASCGPSESTPDAADMAVADVGDETDMGPDLSAADPCQPSEQFWNFTEVRLDEDGESNDYDNSAPIDGASAETVGAVVRNGELLIDANHPEMPPVGSISLKLVIRTDEGPAIPATHQFTEPDQSDSGIDTPDLWVGSYVTYSKVLTSPPDGLYTSTALNIVYGGEVQLDTCPNEVGEFAIGRLVDAEFGDELTYHSILDGEFAFVVYESDGSLNCGEPTLCSE